MKVFLFRLMIPYRTTDTAMLIRTTFVWRLMEQLISPIHQLTLISKFFYNMYSSLLNHYFSNYYTSVKSILYKNNCNFDRNYFFSLFIRELININFRFGSQFFFVDIIVLKVES
jgi:hypothetical protein